MVVLIATATAGVWCSYAAVFPAGAVALFLGARAAQALGPGDRPVVGLLRLLVTSSALTYVQFARPRRGASAFLTELKTSREEACPP